MEAMQALPFGLRKTIGQYLHLVIPGDLAELVTKDTVMFFLRTALNSDNLEMLQAILELNIVDLVSKQEFGIMHNFWKWNPYNLIIRDRNDRITIYDESLLLHACKSRAKRCILYIRNMLIEKGHPIDNVIFNLISYNMPFTLELLMRGLKINDPSGTFVKSAFYNKNYKECGNCSTKGVKKCTCVLRFLLESGIRYSMAYIATSVNRQDLELLRLLLKYIDQAQPDVYLYRQALKRAIKDNMPQFSQLLVQHCIFTRDEMRSDFDRAVSNLWATVRT